MSEHDQGKIALEEHFYLPSFEAYGADGSALDGAGKAHNYQPAHLALPLDPLRNPGHFQSTDSLTIKK